MDDDCTGTNYKRFDAVIQRVKRKEIQVIVFKDASRLGRNLKESLNFVELMEDYGAEIVFESEEYNEDFFPLKAWFNEQRAKEDSLKIRRVLQHKMEEGTLLVKPFYGYRRSEDNAMIPDEETAKVVQWIFQEVLNGKGSNELASELNAMGVPTPSQAAGYSNAMECWVAQHIRRIVTNPVYVGTMIHHKTSKKSFKNKKIMHHSNEDWIVHENHHEPLVDREVFERVQLTRKRFKRMKYTKVNRPFSGLLQCGRCGRPLVLRTRKNRPDAYICAKNHDEGAIKDDIRPNYGCRPHHVREEFLYDIAIRYIKLLLKHSEVDVQDIVRQILRTREEYSCAEELEKKLTQVRSSIDKIYEDRLSGLIRESLFARKYQEYTNLEESLENQLAEIKKTESRVYGEELTDLQLEDIINRLDSQTVRREQLQLVFDRIIVFEPDEITEEKMQQLGLTRENFELIKAKGGIVFVENTEPSIGILAP